MTDIVERLHNLIECEMDKAQCELYATALAEIERLQAELGQVREILNDREAEIGRLRDDQRMLLLCESDRKQMAAEIERLRQDRTLVARITR